MDGKRFDALTQRLAAIRLTRKGAVRGLVGGATVLVGGAAFTGRVEAGKKQSVCHCLSGHLGEGVACTTERMSKQQRKTHLRDHRCDYRGECRSSFSNCAGTPIFIDRALLGSECARTSDCGGRNSGLRCDLGLDTPVCVPIDLGNACYNSGECSTGRCDGGECVNCPEPSDDDPLSRCDGGACVCGSGASAECCHPVARCGVSGLCFFR